MIKNIAVIRGDGIGPEIVGEAIKVLDRIGELYGHTFNYTEADIQRTLDKMGRQRCSLEYANHALAEFLLDSVCEWLNDNGHQELCDSTIENMDLDKLFFELPVK